MGTVNKHPHCVGPKFKSNKGDYWESRTVSHQRLDGLEPGSSKRPRPPEGAQPKQGSKVHTNGKTKQTDRCVDQVIKSGATLTPKNSKERKRLRYMLYCMERKGK